MPYVTPGYWVGGYTNDPSEGAVWVTQPLDIIKRALRTIGALASGEQPDSMTANDCFDMLNDLMEASSNEKQLLHYVSEIVFPIVGGTYQYTIGPGGTAKAVLTASQDGNIVTVTGITSGAITLGQTLSINGTIMGFETGAGGQGTNALGTYVSNINQTVASTTVTAYYERPLRINAGFTRVATIDYPMQILSYEDYKLIGLKSLNGPWPRALYYQPSELYGNLTFWPNPSSGEVHLYTDTILGRFNSLSDTIQMPQGYGMWMRWNLAELLMPEYGKANQLMVTMVTEQAKKWRGNIKKINMQPLSVAHFDPVIMTGKANDAGWIMSGGFN
jgi:hypothetical protein